MVYVYGPVPSRRLGRSLGVDLVPLKTCTYDCIYCQLGRTTCRTTERREWVPLGEVLGQLQAKLAAELDYITLAGSGEPTLFAPLGELIGGIKDQTDVPVAVLTNGSLLWRPEVRKALAAADVVAPSLDAGDERLFRYVNRPHARIRFEQMVEGLIAFRDEYAGRYWLEVFLLGGVTAIPAEVERIARIAERVRPDRIQINTVTRPPGEAFAFPADGAQLQLLAGLFGGRAEVIAGHRDSPQPSRLAAGQQEVLELLRRRPSTAREIADSLGLHPNEVSKYLQALMLAGIVQTKRRGPALYYLAADATGAAPSGTP